ncbi:uncharacterized protein [Arachis hypogaea]|uniref:uncharacterized protein n=1 Tax=Arachis hypogaea TaxID=3818 RepID=UPI003B222AD0
MRVEKGSPYLFKDFVLHIQRWVPKTDRVTQEINKYLVWIQFWWFPKYYKTTKVGRKLGNKIGIVLDVGLFNVKGRETRIVKAKVDMNAGKRVKDCLKVAKPDKTMIKIILRYEKAGTICTYCARIGHEHGNCPVLLEKNNNKKQAQDMVDEWIKAT